jgi:membrane fusion protein (multidrug efflux system)
VAPKSGIRKKLVLSGLAAVTLAAVVGFGGYYLAIGRYMISTDDAYVGANTTTIAARVSGHIQSIAVADNARVHAGDLLVQIDDGDYRLAVEAARDKVATQEATLARIDRQITAQQSAVQQADAQVTSANAATTHAEADFSRQQELTSKGFASKATFDLAQATRDQAAAAVKSAQAAFDAAQANVDVIKAQRAEANGQLQELKTALAKAERDLSFTTIRAPVDGVFSNRIGNDGDFIQPGQRLGNLVPLDAVYIDANFKETQLSRLQPGQHVKISVDAISDRKIDGVVDSVSPASGSVFSLLPPDNATGNFTKIVQRIPVRIRVPADVAKENLLRAGMSVDVSVDTRNDAAVQVPTGNAS